jgi:hypothetical protein
MESEELVRALITGTLSVSDLAPLGVLVEGEPPQCSVTIPAGVSEVLVSPRELSAGLLAAWARSTDLAEWALVTRELVLADDEDSAAWKALMDALWSAAFGEGVPDDALSLARSLTK